MSGDEGHAENLVKSPGRSAQKTWSCPRHSARRFGGWDLTCTVGEPRCRWPLSHLVTARRPCIFGRSFGAEGKVTRRIFSPKGCKSDYARKERNQWLPRKEWGAPRQAGLLSSRALRVADTAGILPTGRACRSSQGDIRVPSHSGQFGSNLEGTHGPRSRWRKQRIYPRSDVQEEPSGGESGSEGTPPLRRGVTPGLRGTPSGVCWQERGVHVLQKASCVGRSRLFRRQRFLRTREVTVTEPCSGASPGCAPHWPR